MSFRDVSIEQVAALSSQNTLPEPNLNLDTLPSSTSTLNYTPNAQPQSSNPPVLAPSPMYPPDDPWGAPRLSTGFDASRGFPNVGPSSALAGSGLPSEWWNKQEDVKVSILGQQGFILNRYTVYEVVTDVSLS
jgi:sorting nexin-8